MARSPQYTPLDVMNNDAFKTLEEEYHAITGALSRKISSLATSIDPNERRALIQEADADIYEATSVLKKMEIEMRHYPYNLKSQCQQQVKIFTNSLDAQKKDLERIKTPATASSGGRGGRGGQKGGYDQQRKMLLEAKHEVDDSEQSLLNTQRTIAQAQEVGNATTITLHAQREQIIRTHGTVRETDDVLVRARRTIMRIARRTVTNKLITAVIIILELAAVGVIVWYRWIR